MNLAEIRDLDGPNLFSLSPTIKLEVTIGPEDRVPDERKALIGQSLQCEVPDDPIAALQVLITALHRRAGLAAPDVATHTMDLPGHIAICFPWEWRSTAIMIAQLSFDLISGDLPDDIDGQLSEAQVRDHEARDQPTWVRDTDRGIPIAAITGTNGKTTTTRLLSHIMRESGYRVGWSSSTGVYINGEQVFDGDYTGHGGARRVLTDPDVDLGVLETARGGILLRGLGFESNDVGVFLNVSADHLDLHGVTSLDTLARVKSTVVRVTRASGVAVLNADDPLVIAQRPGISAEPVLISRNPENPEVLEHVGAGGRAVVSRDGAITLLSGDVAAIIAPLRAVPMTYHGAAGHMVENALAAVAAAIGLGTGQEQILQALQSFQPDPQHNAGRLNVFEVDDRTVVVDYAHNESGLINLVDFAQALTPESSRLTAIIGAAGDRGDSVLQSLGRIAGRRAGRVLLKETPRYLRGREPGDSIKHLRQGVIDSGFPERLSGAYLQEYEAVVAALDTAEPGETIVIMCTEDYAKVLEELAYRGARTHGQAQPAEGG